MMWKLSEVLFIQCSDLHRTADVRQNMITFDKEGHKDNFHMRRRKVEWDELLASHSTGVENNFQSLPRKTSLPQHLFPYCFPFHNFIQKQCLRRLKGESID